MGALAPPPSSSAYLLAMLCLQPPPPRFSCPAAEEDGVGAEGRDLAPSGETASESSAAAASFAEISLLEDQALEESNVGWVASVTGEVSALAEAFKRRIAKRRKKEPYRLTRRRSGRMEGEIMCKPLVLNSLKVLRATCAL